jgi:hypothetical protein
VKYFKINLADLFQVRRHIILISSNHCPTLLPPTTFPPNSLWIVLSSDESRLFGRVAVSKILIAILFCTLCSLKLEVFPARIFQCVNSMMT